MATIPLPYCVPCGNMYRCKENEVIVDLGHAQVLADLYECDDCGHQLTRGYAGEWLPHTLFEQLKNDGYTVIKMRKS